MRLPSPLFVFVALLLAAQPGCQRLQRLFQPPPPMGRPAPPPEEVGGHHRGRQSRAAPAAAPAQDGNRVTPGPAAQPAAGQQPPGQAAPAAKPAPEAAPEQPGRPKPLHVDRDRLVTADGVAVQLHGFNWFGFNTGTGAPDGLWDADPVGGDFARTVHRQRLLGFNAVRLPFSFAEFEKAPRDFHFPCQDVTTAQLAELTRDPEVEARGITPPELPAPPKREAGHCNGYLTANTTRERYLWAVRFLVDNGFYVLADNHFREDRTAEQDAEAWARSWADLAGELQSPELVGRVFFDLLNEPAQYGQLWHKTDKAGVGALYIAAMDAIEQKAPEAIFFLEGTGQDSLGANWGDGYCCDAGKIASLSLSDPRPFFTALAARPYHDRVVLAPHVYGPAVTYAHDNFSGPGLYQRLNASFGDLSAAGLPVEKATLRFPVAIGEFGSHFKDPGDLAFMRDFAPYLRADGAAAGGSRSPVAGWFYWCWNADSGDTGGLVADNWRDVAWEKIRYLESIGLRPWYRGSAGPAPSPTPPPSSSSAERPPAAAGAAPETSGSTPSAGSSQPAPAAPPPLTTRPSQRLEGLRLKTPPTSHPIATGELTSPPALSKSGSEKAPSLPPPSVPRDGRLHAQVAVNSWRDGGGWLHAVNLHLANATAQPVRVPFEIVLSGPKFLEVGQAWGVDKPTVRGSEVRGRVTADWASLPPSGRGTANMGFIYRTQNQDKEAWAVSVNGQSCAVEKK